MLCGVSGSCVLHSPPSLGGPPSYPSGLPRVVSPLGLPRDSKTFEKTSRSLDGSPQAGPSLACVPSGRYVLHLQAPRGGPPPFQSGFPRVVPPVVCRILPLLALSHDWSTLYAIFLGALVTGPATSVVPSRGGHSGSGYASHRAAAHRFFSFFFYISAYHVDSRTGDGPP